MLRFLARALPAVVLVALLTHPADAIFMRPDLEKIPVERLAENLEKTLQKNDKDRQVLYNLARLHAMAYAKKTDTVEIRKGKEAQGAWFGFTPTNVPFSAVTTEDKEKVKAADEHLKKALGRYDEVLKIDAKHLPAKLGKTWLIEQSGKKADALKGYRDLVAEGWQDDQKLNGLPLNGSTITMEAAGYLIPLLDAEKDKDEIADLSAKSAKLKKLPRPVTPIAVPLADGLTAGDLEARSARVRFDADGSGERREWSWITPRAAWLVHDRRGTGEIASALQLFGGVSFWLFWETGYDAMAALDDNRDGELSGKELDGLALWHDANSNGISEPGEVKPLAAYAIVALSCQYRRDAQHPDRIAFSPTGVRYADGKTRPTFDLILR